MSLWGNISHQTIYRDSALFNVSLKRMPIGGEGWDRILVTQLWCEILSSVSSLVVAVAVAVAVAVVVYVCIYTQQRAPH